MHSCYSICPIHTCLFLHYALLPVSEVYTSDFICSMHSCLYLIFSLLSVLALDTSYLYQIPFVGYLCHVHPLVAVSSLRTHSVPVPWMLTPFTVACTSTTDIQQGLPSGPTEFSKEGYISHNELMFPKESYISNN